MRNEECHQPIRIKFPKHSPNKKNKQRMMRQIINDSVDWNVMLKAMKDTLIYGRGVSRIKL